jgi:ferredoxin
VYAAVRMNGKAAIDPKSCTGCGLCVSVCPTEAITQVYY